LEGIRTSLSKHIDKQYDVIGYNLAAAKFVRRQITMDESTSFEPVAEAEQMVGKQLPAEKAQKKRKRVVVKS